MKVTDVDAPGAREPASDEIVREYLMAKLYWLGYRYRLYDNPVQTWVDLESEEDLDYLGARREDVRRVAWRMEQDGLLQPSGFSGAANPTDKLLKLFEAGPNEMLFPQNSQYTSTKELLRIMKSARSSLLVVDNYVDSTLLDMFLSTDEKVDLKVLTSKPKGDWKFLLKRFREQYDRKIEVRVHGTEVHDRYVIVDDMEIYFSGASLKQVGDKLSSLVRLGESAAIAAHREKIHEIWDASSPV